MDDPISQSADLLSGRALHNGPSESIGQPGSRVIHILASSGFLDKGAGKKVGVNGNEGEVPVNVPFQHSLRLAPDKAGAAVLAGSNE